MRRLAGLVFGLLLTVTACGQGQSGGHLYKVVSSAMEPTLHCARPNPGCEAGKEDVIVVRPYGKTAARRADIVVLQVPRLALLECGSTGLFIKRLIGLPGDVWEERSGYVYIDGKKLDEPYVTADRRDHLKMGLVDLPPRGTYTQIPKGRYLVMGDNRNASCDSRRWGLVGRAAIVGKVVEVRR